MVKKIILFLTIDYQVFVRIYRLVFLFVEEEVVVAGVVGPDVFDAFVDLALIFDLLEILYHLHRSNEGKETRSHSIASASHVVDTLIENLKVSDYLIKGRSIAHYHIRHSMPIVFCPFTANLTLRYYLQGGFAHLHNL